MVWPPPNIDTVEIRARFRAPAYPRGTFLKLDVLPFSSKIANTPSNPYEETGRMLVKALSQTLVKEHSFKFAAGSEAHLFLVEELVATLSSWPARFRLMLDASPRY